MEVFLSRHFKKTLKSSSSAARVERLLRDLRPLPFGEALSRFSPRGQYLVRSVGRSRIVAEVRASGRRRLLVFLGLCDDKCFERSVSDPDAAFVAHSPKDQELAEWLERQESEPSFTSLPKPPLPHEYLPWLESPRWSKATDDCVILESEEWVNAIRSQEMQEKSVTFATLAATAADRRDAGVPVSESNATYVLHSNTCSILYSSRYDADSMAYLIMLWAPFRSRLTDDQALTWLTRNGVPGDVSAAHLRRLAYRAYPSWIAAGPDEWLHIQRDERSNLALSPEEEKLLVACGKPATPDQGLPLFINGRAGSGKSTMLRYLFADYLMRSVERALPGRLLFLTQNPGLCEETKRSVRGLATVNHVFLAESTDQLDELLRSSVLDFEAYLLSLLPSTRLSAFEKRDFVSYDRFADLLAESRLLSTPRLRDISPELVWHVIRTYVKGWSRTGLLTPAGYRALPKKAKSVTDEVFAVVHQTVWDWYRGVQQREGLWDSQDLVRAVIDGGLAESEFAVVFCDEAQDFTQLELSLVLELSLFAQYSLDETSGGFLPYAFAGDPFQTINPTGFRWANLSSMFFRLISEGYGGERSLVKCSVSFRELIANYRSTAPLVQFSNTIQLWRRHALRAADLTPQDSWRVKSVLTADCPEASEFILGDNLDSAELESFASQTVIVVPCDPGREGEFVAGDELLARTVGRSQSEGIPANVFSVLSTKGLEFEKVVLYKFGQSCEHPLTEWPTTGVGDRLALEYFLNKLYVAATRARKFLYVVDTAEGHERLWRHFEDAEGVSRLADGEWRKAVGLLRRAEPGSAHELQEENPRVTAQGLERAGMETRNSAVLGRASNFYRLLGETRRADTCEAHRLLFERKYADAGASFARLGMPFEAESALWEGSVWDDLYLMVRGRQGREDSAKYQFSRFMKSSRSDSISMSRLGAFLSRELSAGRFGTVNMPQWRQVVDEYCTRVRLGQHALLSNEGPAGIAEAAQLLESAGRGGFASSLEVAGQLYFSSGDYPGAIRCWRECSTAPRREYLIAQGEVSELPGGLKWFREAGDNERILQKWRDSNRPETKEWLRHVVDALVQEQSYAEACDAAMGLRDWAKAREVFHDWTTRGKVRGGHEDAGLRLVRGLIVGGKWDEAADVLEDCAAAAQSVSERRLEFWRWAIPRIASSGLTRDDSAAIRIGKVMVPELPAGSAWYSGLKPVDVGAALERVAASDRVLQFYDRLAEYGQEYEVRKWAQGRWLVAMGHRLDELRRSFKTARTNRLANEIAGGEKQRRERFTAWGFSRDEVDLFDDYVRPEDGYTARSSYHVIGLPSGVSVTPLDARRLRFTLRAVEFTVYPSESLLLIVNSLTTTQVRVDARQGTVEVFGPGSRGSRSDSSADALEFEVPESGLSGRLETSERGQVLRVKVGREELLFPWRVQQGGLEVQLDAIPQLGPARRAALLKQFGSIQGIASATLDELLSVPGLPESVARAVHRSIGHGQ